MACAGLFSATDLVSRLFLVVLQVLGTSVTKLGFVLVRNARILGNFITPNEEMSSGNDEMEAELDAEAMEEAVGGKHDFLYALRKFRKDCENFATIARISQSLSKFRYAQFFIKLAKFRYHSENSLS